METRLGVLLLLGRLVRRVGTLQDALGLAVQLLNDLWASLRAVHQVKRPGQGLGGGVPSGNDKVHDRVDKHVVGQVLLLVGGGFHEQLQQVLVLAVPALCAALVNQVQSEFLEELRIGSDPLVVARAPVLDLPDRGHEAAGQVVVEAVEGCGKGGLDLGVLEAVEGGAVGDVAEGVEGEFVEQGQEVDGLVGVGFGAEVVENDVGLGDEDVGGVVAEGADVEDQ